MCEDNKWDEQKKNVRGLVYRVWYLYIQQIVVNEKEDPITPKRVNFWKTLRRKMDEYKMLKGECNTESSHQEYRLEVKPLLSQAEIFEYTVRSCYVSLPFL